MIKNWGWEKPHACLVCGSRDVTEMVVEDRKIHFYCLRHKPKKKNRQGKYSGKSNRPYGNYEEN
jgi:hypothetical protein